MEVRSHSQGIFVNAPQVRQLCSWGVRLGTGLSRTQVSASPLSAEERLSGTQHLPICSLLPHQVYSGHPVWTGM